jgi:hypothetical protein
VVQDHATAHKRQNPIKSAILRGLYMGGDARGADVGAMLRAWRCGRDRSLVPGLQAARPSRAYLTQLDMALLLGVSERWYGALERGERRPFARSMIDGVVRILDLAWDQAEVLYAHAGHTPPRRPAGTPNPMLVDLVTRQDGCVSYLNDAAWDVVACNQVAGLHCPWLARPGANVMLWAFSADARFQARDWERSWAVPMLSELRAAWQRSPDNARLAEVVAEVRQQPGVSELWERTAHVTEPYRGTRPMFFPLVDPEPITVRLLAMGLYGSTDLRWIVIEPDDPAVRFT